MDLLQRLAAKEPQGIQQVEDRIHAWSTGLELSGRNLREPISGQTAQFLGCLHLQHLLEMLLGRLHVAGSTGEGEAVHGLRVQGIDLERAAQIVESPQAVALFAEYGAQVLESHGIPGIGCKSLHGVLLGPREVARPLVAERQSHCEFTANMARYLVKEARRLSLMPTISHSGRLRQMASSLSSYLG